MINLKKFTNLDQTQKGYVKADPVKRVIAFVIDSVIAVMIGVIPVFGGILGGLFFLFRDALPVEWLESRSPGKRLIGLDIVKRDTNAGVLDYADSAKRNWMFALNLMIAVPVLGWMIAPLIVVAGPLLVLLETYRVFADDEGKRIGDLIAGTMVIEK
ncbi:MAG: RDD family protein [Proteobacteria bacterium]|nr:RDD family protein [Pseudomonadota bacterium]